MKKIPFLLLSSSLLTSASAQDPPVASTWNYSVIHQDAGTAGLFVLETGNGPEIFCSSEAGASVWLALKHDQTTGGYQTVHVSDAVSTSGLVAFQPVQVTGDATPELVLAHSDGTIAIYDATTRALVSKLRPRSGMLGFIARDIDGDGSPELICSSYFDLFVYDINGQEKWRLNGTASFRLAIGQMDADPALEIATIGGQVVDTGTRTLQWDSPAEWYPLTLADIDGDGMDEVIANGGWDDVSVYDVDTQSLKWSTLTGDGINDIHLDNVDNDPELELLTTGFPGTKAFDLSAGGLSQKWTIINPDGPGLSLASGELDGDSEVELVHISCNPDTWGGRLRVAGTSSLDEAWVSPPLMGPFVGVGKGDVTGDGIPEYVFASAQSGGKKGARIQMLDTNTLSLTGVSEPVLDPEAGAEIMDVSLCDIDGDGRFEVAVTGVADNTGFSGLFAEVYRFDAVQGFVKLWSMPREFSPLEGRRIEVLDVDGNGDLEVVVAGQQVDSSAGSRIFVFDYDSVAEQWHSPDLPASWTGPISVAISDVDADGSVEAVLGCPGSGFQVFDLGSRSVEQSVDLPKLTCVAAHAGWPEWPYVSTGFWVGTNRGEIPLYRKNAQGIYAGGGDIPFSGASSIRQIIPAAGGSMFTVTEEDRLTLYEPHGIPKWQTELLPGQLSQRLTPLHTVDGWEVFSNLGFGGSIFPLDVLDVERHVSLFASGALREGQSSAATLVLTRHTAGPETMVVRFSVSGAATPGVDYQITGATQAADGFWEAVIPAGDVSATVNLTLAEDALPEGNETIDLMLANGGFYGPSSDRVARLRIADDETVVGVYFARPWISEVPSPRTAEGIDLVFLRSGDLSATLNVPFTLSGSATNGKDFTRLKKSVTFDPGIDRVVLNVAAGDDGMAEGDETLAITLSPASTHGLKPGGETAELTIQDPAN